MTEKGLNIHSTDLLEILEKRFAKNMQRHEGLNWSTVQAKLDTLPDKLQALFEMEQTGGEPDVIAFDEKSGVFVFCDCSPESPPERRSLCYDRKAWEARKKFKPGGNVIDMAAAMGIELLTEDQYLELQELGEFDKKTSSWIHTPDKIRKHGGALFCDRRYDHVFTYHNGADSYYAARGFRGRLSV